MQSIDLANATGLDFEPSNAWFFTNIGPRIGDGNCSDHVYFTGTSGATVSFAFTGEFYLPQESCV